MRSFTAFFLFLSVGELGDANIVAADARVAAAAGVLVVKKVLAVICGCSAFVGPVFKMKDIAEMSCMVVESTF